MWRGVRFERLLAVLKSKRDKQTITELLRFLFFFFFGASVRWAFWNDKRFRPWDPNNLRMDLAMDTAALRARMAVTVSGRSLVVSCGLFFQPAGIITYLINPKGCFRCLSIPKAVFRCLSIPKAVCRCL